MPLVSSQRASGYWEPYAYGPSVQCYADVTGPTTIAPGATWDSGPIVANGFKTIAAFVQLTQSGNIEIRRFIDAAGTMRQPGFYSAALSANNTGTVKVGDMTPFYTFRVLITNNGGATANVSNFGVFLDATPITFADVSLLVLDRLSVPLEAAYAMRRLAGSYSGPLIKVRRASDNGEIDIYASKDGTLDTGTLFSVGFFTSLYLVTWYDQSGNGRHLQQATQALQPRISNNGTFERLLQGIAVRSLAGSNMLMRATFGLNQPLWATFSTQLTAWPAASEIIGGATAKAGLLNNAGKLALTAASIADTGVAVPSTPSIVSYGLNGATSSIWVNGVQQGALLAPGAGNPGGITLFGNELGSANADAMIGGLTVFSSILSTTDRQTLERALGSYWGIAVA